MKAYNAGASVLLDTESASCLENIGKRRMQIRIKQGKTSSVLTFGQGGKSGTHYMIPLSALSPEAQERYRLMQAGGAASDADLTAYRERYGDEGLQKLMGRLGAVLEMQSLRGRKDATARRAEIAREMGVLPRCVYDWEHKYERDGLEGLMDKTMRSDKGRSRSLCALAQDRINYLYMAPGKLSQNRVYQTLTEMRGKLGEKVCEECCHNPESFNRAEMIEKGIDPGEECRQAGKGLVVSDSRCAVNRYVSGLDKAVITLGRYGEKPFDDLFMPKCRRDKPDMTNAVWFGDHHVFDLFVEKDGKAVRPWLTAWMDACSGCIVGWAISTNPNSDTIVEALTLGITHTKGSPFWGMPEWIYIDNGKDYRCKRIEGDGVRDYQPGRINVNLDGDNALLKTLGIGVTHAIPYRARSKTIERIFGIIETQWIRGLPGYCGNGIDLKPEQLAEDIRKNRLMTYEEFVALWVNSIMPRYHDYKAVDSEHTPLEIYESHQRARLEMPSYAMLAIAKSLREERVVRTDGIYLKGTRYWDDALANIVGQRVQVLYYRDQIGTVSIMQGGAFLCEAEAASNFRLIGEDPQALEEHMKMQRTVRKTKLAALQLPEHRARILDTMAVEIPDMAQAATITSVVHERAYRGRQEAIEKHEAKQDAKRKVRGALREKYEAAGLALLERPDAD